MLSNDRCLTLDDRLHYILFGFQILTQLVNERFAIGSIDHPGRCRRQRKDHPDQAPEEVFEPKGRSLRYDEGAWGNSYRRKDQTDSA
jgi:hypothetical protein